MKEEYKKLGKNTAWMVVGNFASKLLSFFLVPLYTYNLTTDDYGIADLMTTTISLLSPLLTIAASEGILRFTLDEKYEKGKIFTLSMLISGLGFIVMLLFSPIIIKYASFRDYYLLFVLYYLTTILSLLVQQFVKGLNQIRDYAISGFLHTLIGATLNILLLAVFHQGIKGYLYSMIIGGAAPSVYLIIKQKIWKYIRKPSVIDKLVIKKYILYCLPLVTNQLSWWVNNSSDKYILTHFWGTSANGIYSVSYKIPSLIATISTIFYSAWQISAVDDFGSEKSIKFFSDVYRKYVSIFVVSASGLIMFTKPLAKILFAKDFFNAWPYAIILIIAAIFQSLNSFVGTIYTSALKTKAIFFTTLIGAVTNTILNLILIPKMAAYGAAIATVFSYVMILIIRVIHSQKYLKMRISYIRDIFNYSVIFVQSIITCLQVRYWIIFNGILFIVLVVVNHEVIIDFMNVIKSKFRRRA